MWKKYINGIYENSENLFLSDVEEYTRTGKYTFEKFEEELEQGYELYYTYVRNRYMLFKTSDNCYTQKLVSDHPKNPQPMVQIVTHKRIFEMFAFMEDFEYKVGAV